MRIIASLLDSLFPKRDDEALIAAETPDSFLRLFQPHQAADGVALSLYADPLVRAAITENKFHNNAHAAKLLGSLLSAWCKGQSTKILLIPLPLGATRRRLRGYNQTERIVKAAVANAPTLASLNLLERIRETAPQASLGRHERLQNVTGAFRVRTGQLPSHYASYRLILVDDVITTGATLQAAKATLLPHLPGAAEVHCVGIAH